MDSKGMMAVVRGTPDAGLMVTLVDGGRQYTLMPQAEVNGAPPREREQSNGNKLSRHSQYSRSDVRGAGASTGAGVRAARCDSGAQAVDDRYTSNYKIEYCHTKPTSPPVELTEFPPQRAHIQPGQENFQVGGYSLKSFATRTINCHERGHCPYPVPRVSTSNAFENSLRRYPCASPESSSEVVERLISFTKFTNSSTSPIENNTKLQNCVTCYQVSQKRKSPKYKSNKQRIPWRQSGNSPIRDKDLRSSEGNQTSEYHEDTKNTIFCKDIVAMGNVITNYRNHLEELQTQQGGNLRSLITASEKVNEAVGFTKKSLVDIPISNFEEDLLLAKQEDNQQTAMSRNNNIGSYSLQNVRSMQMIKSIIVANGMKRKMNYCKFKKIKSPIQSHTKCKKFKHKPRLRDNEINKLERKRLKSELLHLIRQFHSSKEEDKLEEKIKTVLYKLIDCTLDTRKTNHLNKDVLKHCTRISNTKEYQNSLDADVIKHNIKFVLKKHTNDVTEIHRIILEEMLPLLKYHVFKEHENKVLKFILSKIIKDIVDIVRKMGVNHSVNSKNSSEYRYHLNKLKEICGNKKLLYNIHNTSQVKKYCRYLNAIKKLVKSDATCIGSNGNLMSILKEPTDLKLRSVINIYRALKRIQSTSFLQAQYVTNMLLNQFCNAGNRWNENLNYYGAIRKKTSTLKCLSDTYIMLRDSSKNKSILTKNKVDKMNLYTTKLLASIKNKCTFETRHTDSNYKCQNENNPYKQGTICVNDISTVPLSFKNSKTNYNENKKYKLDVKNTSILNQVEEKVNTWLNKFASDSSLTNNICHNCNLKELCKDLANQLVHLKLKKTLRNIKKENIADCFRCVICKHLFVTFDDHSFELVKKVSELITGLLSIYTCETSHLNQVNLRHQYSQVPSTSIENYDGSLQFVRRPPESRLIQAESNLIEDIYLKVPFCDESVRQVFPKTFSKEERNNKINKTVPRDELQHQFKYLDIEESKNRSGVINVALASAKSDKGENTVPNIKCNKTCSASSTRKKSNSNISTLNNSEDPNNSKTDELKYLPDNLTRQQLHEYCVETFRNLCKELPIIATKPDLTELAREGVLHNTLKIFYMLQEDPDVESNCTYFELCFEDEIDGLIDMLPQTEEMKKMRQEWTSKLVGEAAKIYKAMICTRNKEVTEESTEADTNGQKSINEERPEIERSNVLKLVDQFLDSTNYQEENSLKEKIYRQRLIKCAYDVNGNTKRKDSNSLGKLPMDDTNKIVFKELESVPKPDNDITKEEINLAKLNIEIEKWYDELPVKPSETLNEDEKKLKTYELAQKIYNVEICMDCNEPSSETSVEQEICMFICNMIDKFDDKDLNINLMIEELVTRIRKLQQELTLDYETFQKALPFNSTLIQHDNICDGETCNQNAGPCLTKNNTLNQNEQNSLIIQNDYTNKDNNARGSMKDNIARLRPIAKTAAKGILGCQFPGTIQEGCCPKPRHSPATASLYTPLTSSPRRNTYESDQLCDESKWGQFSSNRVNSINSDRRASAQFSRMDYNQKPDDHVMSENVPRHSFIPGNFLCGSRQASSKILPVGRNYAPSSTRQAPPFIPMQRTDNEMQRDQRNSLQIESGRERDHNRIRCRCGDRHFRRRSRYDCCCEDYFSVPHCCLLPYEHYF